MRDVRTSLLYLCLLLTAGLSANAALAIDVNVSADANAKPSGTQSITTTSFSTGSANELLLLFIQATNNGGTISNVPTVSSVSGAGLAWSSVVTEGVSNSNAMVSVYKAVAVSQLTAQTVTATLTLASAGGNMSITLLSFTGADTTNGVGATAVISATAGSTFSVSLSTTASNSWVFSCGSDWNSSTARTMGTAQTLVHADRDTGDGVTLWVQRTNSSTASSGSNVTINDTAPTNWIGDGAAVEVLASGGIPPPRVVSRYIWIN